jgi:hypothetical protein
MSESVYSSINKIMGVADLDVGNLADYNYIKDQIRMQQDMQAASEIIQVQ